MSPLVWNMAFDALLDKFNRGPIKAKGFANDAALVIKDLDIPSLIDKGQEAINIATSFGRERGLEFGAEETVVVVFTRRKFSLTQVDKLWMGNFPLDFSGEAKYLGVTLDSRLTFGPHIDYSSEYFSITLQNKEHSRIPLGPHTHGYKRSVHQFCTAKAHT